MTSSYPPVYVDFVVGWKGEIYQQWEFPNEVIEVWYTHAREYGDNGIFLSSGWFEN